MFNKVYKEINQLFKEIFENNVIYYYVYEINLKNETKIVTIKVNGEDYNLFYDKKCFRFHNVIDNHFLKDYSKYLLNITLLKNRLEKNELAIKELL